MEKAFDILYLRHEQKVKTLLHFVLRNHVLEEDAFQDTWMEAFIRICDGRYIRGDLFVQWIKKIAKHKAFHILKKEKHYTSRNNQSEMPDESLIDYLSPEEILNRKVRIEFCHEIIQWLPPYLKEIVWMRYVGDLSYEEIAERKRSDENVIRSAISKAKTKLREIYEMQVKIPEFENIFSI